MKQLGATTVSEGTTATSGGTTVTSTSTMATAPSNASGNIIDLDTSSVADNNSYNEQVLLLCTYIMLLFNTHH